MTTIWLGLPLYVWSIIALTIAVMYLFVYPRKQITPTTAPLKRLLLRWGHALVWILMSISFVVRGSNVVVANMLALAALGMYLGFLFALSTTRTSNS